VLFVLVVFEILPAKSNTTFNQTQDPPINPAQNPATHGAAASTGSQPVNYRNGNQLPTDTHPMNTHTQSTIPQDTYTDQHTRRYDDEPPNQYGDPATARGVNTGAPFTRGPAGGITAGRGLHNNMVHPGGQHVTHGGQYSQYPNVTTANTFNANQGGRGNAIQPPNTEETQTFGDQYMTPANSANPEIQNPRGMYIYMGVCCYL